MDNIEECMIYKIVGSNLNYYGSTELTLKTRLSKHTANYKQYKKGNANYVTSFSIIEKGSYDIVLVEELTNVSKQQKTARERFYIENFECINKYIPGRTKEEYRNANRNKLNSAARAYHARNKDRIKKKKEAKRKQDKMILSFQKIQNRYKRRC